MSVEGGGFPAGGVADIEEVTDALVVSVTETTGTFSFDESSAAEQDALELVIAARVLIGAIWLDLSNVTRDTTIKAYHKIDGTNYRLFQSTAWTDGVDPDGQRIAGFTAYRDVKVSLTCAGGGGSVDVPYTVV